MRESKLRELREKIDELDDAIAELVLERALLSEAVGKEKQLLSHCRDASLSLERDLDREQKILNRVAQKFAIALPNYANAERLDSMRQVFSQLIVFCFSFQSRAKG